MLQKSLHSNFGTLLHTRNSFVTNLKYRYHMQDVSTYYKYVAIHLLHTITSQFANSSVLQEIKIILFLKQHA